MLAISGDVPADDAAWAFEPKYDGMRGLAYVTRSAVRVYSRHGKDSTRCYPYCEPRIRVRVGHIGRTASGLLREPVFRGLADPAPAGRKLTRVPA